MSTPAFLQGILGHERGLFSNVVSAVPEEGRGHRPDPKARCATDIIEHLIGHNAGPDRASRRRRDPSSKPGALRNRRGRGCDIGPDLRGGDRTTRPYGRGDLDEPGEVLRRGGRDHGGAADAAGLDHAPGLGTSSRTAQHVSATDGEQSSSDLRPVRRRSGARPLTANPVRPCTSHLYLAERRA